MKKKPSADHEQEERAIRRGRRMMHQGGKLVHDLSFEALT